MKNPGAALRDLFAKPDLSRCIGVHDAMTARLAQAGGFPSVAISGNSVAAFQFGLPDLGFITLTEMVDACRRITSMPMF